MYIYIIYNSLCESSTAHEKFLPKKMSSQLAWIPSDCPTSLAKFQSSLYPFPHHLLQAQEIHHTVMFRWNFGSMVSFTIDLNCTCQNDVTDNLHLPPPAQDSSHHQDNHP